MALKLKYDSIPIKNMAIEEAYHYERPLDEKRVRKIVREYDPKQVSQIILSYRDGVYYIIDGQHTVEATRRIFGEEYKLNSKVFYELTPQEEADQFHKHNTNKKPLSRGDDLNAKVISGDVFSNHYVNLMKKHNFPYVYANAQNGIRTFSAHDTGQRALRMFGEKAFEDALDVMNATKEVTHYQGRCLEGLALLFSKCTIQIDLKALEKAINETGEPMLRAKIENEKKLQSGKSAVRTSTAIVFGQLYNKGRRSKKIDLSNIKTEDV